MTTIGTFMKLMSDGGPFMYIIFSVWVFGIVMCIYKTFELSVVSVNGKKLFEAIKGHVVSNEVDKAIHACSDSKAVLPKILHAGLKRANMEKESISDAIEAKYAEVGPRVTSLIIYITLAANISTLLGLLGTIDGLIDSFASLSTVDPSMKSKVLAQGISKAMNTTLLGLTSAITIMVFNTFVSSRANRVLLAVNEYSHKMLDLLSCKKRIED